MGSVASALAEAWESGKPVAPLTADLALSCLEAAEEVAGDVLERLALPPCGVRVSETGLVGAMLPGRIAATGQTLPLSVLPHGRAAPALLTELAEAITPDGTGLPALERLHPALDLSASRWRDGPANLFEASADLAGLGQVVIGKGKRTGFPSSCALAPQRADPARAIQRRRRCACPGNAARMPGSGAGRDGGRYRLRTAQQILAAHGADGPSG